MCTSPRDSPDTVPGKTVPWVWSGSDLAGSGTPASALPFTEQAPNEPCSEASAQSRFTFTPYRPASPFQSFGGSSTPLEREGKGSLTAQILIAKELLHALRGIGVVWAGKGRREEEPHPRAMLVRQPWNWLLATFERATKRPLEPFKNRFDDQFLRLDS